MRKGWFLSILSFVLILSVSLQAQTRLPLDPMVRHGKLDNGLTYYIRHNSMPENRGDFYLVQKVGAMQEEDDQDGLAHFLEHMAFSSTKNFPKNVISGVEKYGAQMGPNINAYTAYDQTVYYLSSIPLLTPGAVDTCLLILHDWSNSITLKDEDIDKERKVIKEEWRTRAGAYSRIAEKQRPEILAGSKYSKRDIIGKMDIVENFPYQTLKDYYHKWYRPDLQAVIVVGDFNVDSMEMRVKEIFADIPKAVAPAERIYFPVPDNRETIVSIATDPEATSTSLTIYNKHDITPFGQRNTAEWRRVAYLDMLASNMLSGRLAEIGEKADAPYNGAYAYDSNFAGAMTKDAWISSASIKEGRLEDALRTLTRENERIIRHGFTQPELDRAKANILRGLESRYNNRNTQQTAMYVNVLMGNFLQDYPAMDIGAELELSKEIFSDISIEDVNEAFRGRISDKNVVISASGPQKEGLVYPNREAVMAIIKDIKAENIEPYVDMMVNEPMVSDLPSAGKVVKSEKGKLFDETIWTLSNGMKVVLKKTPYREDQIMMSGSALGGLSLFDDSEWLDMKYLNSVTGIGGVGNFSSTALTKALAGKNAYVSPYISDYNVSLNGSSSVNDFETMLQLAYLNMTAPRKDAEAFAAAIERERNSLKNRDSNPSAVFSDSVNKTLYGRDNLRMRRTELEDLGNVDYDRVLEMYKESFANPGAFVFSFVGNVDEEAVKPLVEKYLGALPSGSKDVTYKPIDKNIRKGDIKNNFTQKMETPKASVTILFSGNVDRDSETIYKSNVLNQLLQLIYFRTIRGDEGGAYGVGAYMDVYRIPAGKATLRVSYTTNPERVDDMNKIVYRELQNLVDNGPLDEEYQKAIEAVIKERTDWQQHNGFWNAVLDDYYTYGEDENTDYVERTKAVTKEDVSALVKELLSQNNTIEVVMIPEM